MKAEQSRTMVAVRDGVLSRIQLLNPGYDNSQLVEACVIMVSNRLAEAREQRSVSFWQRLKGRML